jgi:hypothetical protein
VRSKALEIVNSFIHSVFGLVLLAVQSYVMLRASMDLAGPWFYSPFFLLTLLMSSAFPLGLACVWYQRAKGRYKMAFLMYLIPVVIYLAGYTMWHAVWRINNPGLHG